HLDPVRSDLRYRWRPVRAAGRHHQSQRDVAGELDRDRHLDGGGWARHAYRSGARRFCGEPWQELVHQGIPGVLAVRARIPVHLVDAVPAAGHRGAAGQAQEKVMSATSRPEHEYRSAEREGTPSVADTPIREQWDDANAGAGTRVMTEGVDTSHKGILYLDEISVSFDGFKALNALSLLIDNGELRCVIGPNGAGKTTMMDVITGKTRPDTGTAFFGQTIDLSGYTEAEIATAGIGRKFPKPTGFAHHTVFENLELAMKADKGVWASLRAKRGRSALE